MDSVANRQNVSLFFQELYTYLQVNLGLANTFKCYLHISPKRISECQISFTDVLDFLKFGNGKIVLPFSSVL